MFPALSFPQYSPILPINTDLPPLVLDNPMFNDAVYYVAVQDDLKAFASGFFTTLEGETVNRLARFNTDGSPDTVYNAALGTGFNANVLDIGLLPSGELICASAFTSFNGTAVPYLVKLSEFGVLDAAFDSSIGSGPNDQVYCVIINPTGDIFLGGPFTSFNGTPVGRLAKLSSLGILDTSFDSNFGTGFSANPYDFCVTSTGKLLATGNFTSVNGTPVGRLCLLDADGTPNAAFNANVSATGLNGAGRVILELADGRILVGGEFTSYQGNARNRIICLNPDGTEDVTFYTNTNGGASNFIYAARQLPNGRILIGGLFSTFGGNSRLAMVCLNPDGTEYTTFASNIAPGVASGASAATVRRIELQGNRVVVGGAGVTAVAGQARDRMFYLDYNGNLL